jgi:hypothetical protein
MTLMTPTNPKPFPLLSNHFISYPAVLPHLIPSHPIPSHHTLSTLPLSTLRPHPQRGSAAEGARRDTERQRVPQIRDEDSYESAVQHREVREL